MAVKFLEPGGDATFNVATTTTDGFWAAISGVAVATDFVHGNHQKSIKFRPNNGDFVVTPDGVIADAGGRISFYFYMAALPTGQAAIMQIQNGGSGNASFQISISSAGVIRMEDGAGAQIGLTGATLKVGQWYRICIADTVTSTIVNRIEVFVDGVSSISITNATISTTGTSRYKIANNSVDLTLDFRGSDFYVDNSAALTDTGNIWVTAKRPFTNGSANGFTTQIGAGGSSYGTGHAPQVNERPASQTNGWSIAAVGVTTEEYNIEGLNVGDFNLLGATIVDYMGWVDTKALVGETGQLILNGVNTAIAITATAIVFTAIAGSTVYPTGAGVDIGMSTDATVTTVSLYEAGVIVAFIPGGSNVSTLPFLGAG